MKKSSSCMWVGVGGRERWKDYKQESGGEGWGGVLFLLSIFFFLIYHTIKRENVVI